MAKTYHEKEIDERLKLQVLDQIPTPVIAINMEYELIYVNDAATKLRGRSKENLLGYHCYEMFGTPHCNTPSCCMRKAMETGEMFSARNEIPLDEGGSIPIMYYTVPLKDDDGNVIGGLEYIVDITDQVSYEARIKEQSKQMSKMSTPTIKLWEGVLVLPVIGVVDSLRAQLMMESMLDKIVETSAKVILLDIQGVAAVDTAIANHLIKITKATKLMGCECILSGISPAVAQTIIQLGIDMIDSIKTMSTLSDGLAEAFKILNMRVEKID